MLDVFAALTPDLVLSSFAALSGLLVGGALLAGGCAVGNALRAACAPRRSC